MRPYTRQFSCTCEKTLGKNQFTFSLIAPDELKFGAKSRHKIDKILTTLKRLFVRITALIDNVNMTILKQVITLCFDSI